MAERDRRTERAGRAGPGSSEDLAAEVWRRMFGFLIDTAPRRGAVLGRLGLTPNDARALQALDPEEGRTMRSLADEWACDASNATWIIDKLEERGYAQRRAHPSDRRVKLVVLTQRGSEMRDELRRDMDEPPAELRSLGRADLEALRRALAKLPDVDRSRPSGG